MSEGSTEKNRDPETPDNRTPRIEAVVDYCIPSERNVKGPERVGRTVIGIGIGGFGITGGLAATRPLIGTALTVTLLVVTAYLLVTAKTQKCPVKHMTKKQLNRG